MTRRRTIAAAASGTALVTALALAPPASADDGGAWPGEPNTVALRLMSPLGLAVANDGTLFVAENDFTKGGGRLTQVNPRSRTRAVLVKDAFGITGVATTNGVRVAFTSTAPPESPEVQQDTFLSVERGKKATRIASLWDFEQAENPDAGASYGTADASLACQEAATVLEPFVGPTNYMGILESNPYKVANDGNGWLVADAAGNDLLSVRRNGDVSVVAVLPPVPVELTADLVAQTIAGINENLPEEVPPIPDDALDDCVGEPFLAEPVPTDVEIGPDGAVYVSSLPGAPEAPGSGGVFRIDRSTGEVERVVDGLTGAVDLAVDGDGGIWVAELFSSQISYHKDGEVQHTIAVDSPAAVELHRGDLYVTAGVFGPDGRVLRYRLR